MYVCDGSGSERWEQAAREASVAADAAQAKLEAAQGNYIPPGRQFTDRFASAELAKS